MEQRLRLVRVDVASKTFSDPSGPRRAVRRYHLAYDAGFVTSQAELDAQITKSEQAQLAREKYLQEVGFERYVAEQAEGFKRGFWNAREQGVQEEHARFGLAYEAQTVEVENNPAAREGADAGALAFRLLGLAAGGKDKLGVVASMGKQSGRAKAIAKEVEIAGERTTVREAKDARAAGPSGRVGTRKFLEKRWDKATFPSVEKTVEYHVGKHGKGLPRVPTSFETAPPRNLSTDGRRLERRSCRNHLEFLTVTRRRRVSADRPT